MNKKLFTLFIAATMLFGCTNHNSTKETKSNDNASVTQNTETKDTTKSNDTENPNTETDKHKATPHVAIEVVKKLAETEDNPLYLTKDMLENVEFIEKNGNEEHCEFYVYGNEDEDEGDAFIVSQCYPLKEGGYAVIFTRTSGCCLCYYDDYSTYYYENGLLTEATDLLPQTTINDFYSNADNFPKKAYDELDGCYKRYLFDAKTNQLLITLDPYICIESIRVYLPKALRGLYLKIDEDFEDLTESEQRDAIGEGNFELFPKIAFQWDGEKFVRDPDSKPLEEDLKYFNKFDEFIKHAYDINDLIRGDGCMDLAEDLNGDGFTDFVNNDYEWQELVIYLNDGNNEYNRFGVYECLEKSYISNYSVTDGILEISVYGDSGEYTYQFHFEDGDFCLIDHPEVKIGSFKFGEQPF